MSQENVIEQTENTEPKKRGVPLGTKRPLFFVHAAIVDGKVVMNAYEGSEKETAKAFKKEFKTESASCLGPVRKVAEKKAANVSTKDSIRLSSTDALNVTSKRFEGEYKGWKVVGVGMKPMTVNGHSYGANELVRVICDSQLNPADKVRKPRLGDSDVLPAEVIKNITELA